jgi:hypothetical protein
MPYEKPAGSALHVQVPKKMSVKFYEERENEILMVAEDIV